MNISRSMLLIAALVVAAAASAQSAAPKGQGDYAVGEKPRPEVKKPPPPGVRDLAWDDMVPADWNPRKIFDEAGFDKMEDGDPRALELMEKVRAEWDRAPVVKSLAGQKVRLPGFVVTLEGDEKSVREFLLVPYFGACIHVPPPPSNQVVHVFPAKPMAERLAMYPVWVSGTIKTGLVDTVLGSAGYRIDNAVVEEYPWR